MGGFPPGTWAEVVKAPDHVVDLLMSILTRQTPENWPPPGSHAYVQEARAEARVYADRIWSAAALTGAAFQLAVSLPKVLIQVTPAEMSELKRYGSESVQPGAVDQAGAGGAPAAAPGAPGESDRCGQHTPSEESAT